MKHFFTNALTGLRSMVLLTIILGILYPVAVWATGQVIAKDKADGSILSHDGHPVGSALIAQQFEGDEWLWPRPSAANYDGAASAGSNLGPNSPELLQQVKERRAQFGKDAPADALTASSSGLDPDISPKWAAQQVDRIAKARGIDAGTVKQCVSAATSDRMLGFLGEPTVNVLKTNLCLAGDA